MNELQAVIKNQSKGVCMKVHKILICLSMINVLACEKKNDDSNNVELKNANPIVSTSWCNIFNMEDPSKLVVKTVKLTQGNPNVAQYGYLKINSKLEIINSYDETRIFKWAGEGDATTIGATKYYSGDFVAMIDTDVKSKSSSTFLYDQGTNLLRMGQKTNEIKTDKILKLKNTYAVDKESFIEQYIPCDSISSSLSQPSQKLPIVNFNIEVGNTFYYFRPTLAKMQLKLPIVKTDFSNEKINNTAWCSWFAIDSKLSKFFVKIAAFKNNKLKQASMNDDIPDMESLKKAKNYIFERDTLSYDYEAGDTYITGKSDTPEQLSKAANYITAVDADGTEILIESNGREESQYTLVTPNETYYKCDDPRPYEVSPDAAVTVPEAVNKLLNSVN